MVDAGVMGGPPCGTPLFVPPLRVPAVRLEPAADGPLQPGPEVGGDGIREAVRQLSEEPDGGGNEEQPSGIEQHGGHGKAPSEPSESRSQPGTSAGRPRRPRRGRHHSLSLCRPRAGAEPSSATYRGDPTIRLEGSHERQTRTYSVAQDCHVSTHSVRQGSNSHA